MFDRSGAAFQVVAQFLIAPLLLSFGCAKPVMPPAASYGETIGAPPGAGFSAIPQIIADERPIIFVGLTDAQREAFERYREKFDEDREQRIQQRAPNAADPMVRCVFATLIIFSPVCLVVVPWALRLEGRYYDEPYMPSLPSDRELRRVEAKIKENFTAASIVRRVTSAYDQERGERQSIGYPRLGVVASSATFTPERMILLRVFVNAEPSTDVAWQPTEHRYHLSYPEDEASLVRGLAEAEASVAKGILSTYRLIDVKSR